MIVVSLAAIVAAVVLSVVLLAVEVVRHVAIRRNARRTLRVAGSPSCDPLSGRRPGIHWETPTVVTVMPARRDGGAVR